MPRKLAKRAKPSKQTPIEERLGPLRMAHPAVQRALAEGLCVEPIPTEEVNEELHKLIWASDQPEMVVQRYKVRYDEALTDAERKEVLRGFNEEHHNTAMESKWFQQRCAEHSMLDALRPAGTSTREPRPEETLSNRLSNGKFCDQVISDLRRIRRWCVDSGRRMDEIRKDLPDSPVWNLDLPAEDKECLLHPGMWGAVVGYGERILGKHFGKSPDTIRDWRKEYRQHARKSKQGS
jgi:hypothetical protein